MKLLAHYTNGNYEVTLFDDGTKIRKNDLDSFEAEFPESMDVKITNRCPMGCPMCHEQSTPNGDVGDILENSFINSLHPGTELALGGGAVTSHPDLVQFLRLLKERKVFPSITVHQREFEDNWMLINDLIKEDLVYGIGVSFSYESPMWDMIKDNDNIVVHFINGVHTKDDFDYIASKNMKVLILGYKLWGRGEIYSAVHNSDITDKMSYLYDNLEYYTKYFKVISFDNLAIEQLEPKRILSQADYDRFFQGEDGSHTMYIDLVKRQFAKTSTSSKRYKMLDSVDDMFKIIKEG